VPKLELFTGKKEIIIAVLLIASISMAIPAKVAQASPTIFTFSDKTIFLAATGATSATGPLPNLGQIPGGAAATQTVGNVTFSLSPPSSALFIGTGGAADWTVRLPGPDIGISDVENLNMDLASPVFSLGFDFVKPQTDPNVNAAFGNSTFTVTLKNGATTVDSFNFSSPSIAFPTDTADFVGVWSDAAFNRVEIRETVGGIDNEFFGQVYTGIAPPGGPVLTLFLNLTKTPDKLVAHPGETITYSYDVNVTGNGQGGAASVTDNKCSPSAVLGVDGFNIGDTVSKGFADAGEVWKFTCSVPVTTCFEHPIFNNATARVGTNFTGVVASSASASVACTAQPPVGGEILGVDSTSLFVAGALTNAGLIIPIVGVVAAGIIGFGLRKRIK